MSVKDQDAATPALDASLHADRILILDFGSQVTQLIARRVRESGVYCEIWPFTASEERIRKFAPRGIILSGGPASVHDEGAPTIPDVVFALNVPVLGICYGQQAMCKQLGGEVEGSDHREFGTAFADLPEACATPVPYTPPPPATTRQNRAAARFPEKSGTAGVRPRYGNAAPPGSRSRHAAGRDRSPGIHR